MTRTFTVAFHFAAKRMSAKPEREPTSPTSPTRLRSPPWLRGTAGMRINRSLRYCTMCWRMVVGTFTRRRSASGLGLGC